TAVRTVEKGWTHYTRVKASIDPSTWEAIPTEDLLEVEIKEKNLIIETGNGDVNAWIEWVKYIVQSLNHSYGYACGMRCMIALYQEKTAWGNETCKSLFAVPCVTAIPGLPLHSLQPLVTIRLASHGRV
uniref:Uncharacterized protein n=1 Tax=Cairina moschata TaxID=8855 RepID=A0A8C3C8L7_CAIMO